MWGIVSWWQLFDKTSGHCTAICEIRPNVAAYNPMYHFKLPSHFPLTISQTINITTVLNFDYLFYRFSARAIVLFFCAFFFSFLSSALALKFNFRSNSYVMVRKFGNGSCSSEPFTTQLMSQDCVVPCAAVTIASFMTPKKYMEKQVSMP